MKTFAAALTLAAATQALELEYKQSERPDLDASQQQFDPEEMTDYDSITGRGDTQEGDNTRKNVLVYEDEEDEDKKYRPMCHTGGIENTPDTEGPSEECCRVYEYANFEGRHYDFCLYNVDSFGDDECPEKYWQADTYGWHNEITSFWCGEKVGIRLCAHYEDASATDDKKSEGECRGGNSNVIEDVGQKAQLGDEIID